MRRGERWAFVTAIAVPVVALGVALPFPTLGASATLGHLGLIYLAVVIFLVGVVITFSAMRGRVKA